MFNGFCETVYITKVIIFFQFAKKQKAALSNIFYNFAVNKYL